MLWSVSTVAVDVAFAVTVAVAVDVAFAVTVSLVHTARATTTCWFNKDCGSYNQVQSHDSLEFLIPGTQC